MASTPDILTKLNVGSGMNNSEIITSLVDAERAPALERIEKNDNKNKNKILRYRRNLLDLGLKFVIFKNFLLEKL